MGKRGKRTEAGGYCTYPGRGETLAWGPAPDSFFSSTWLLKCLVRTAEMNGASLSRCGIRTVKMRSKRYERIGLQTTIGETGI